MRHLLWDWTAWTVGIGWSRTVRYLDGCANSGTIAGREDGRWPQHRSGAGKREPGTTEETTMASRRP